MASRHDNSHTTSYTDYHSSAGPGPTHPATAAAADTSGSGRSEDRLFDYGHGTRQLSDQSQHHHQQQQRYSHGNAQPYVGDSSTYSHRSEERQQQSQRSEQQYWSGSEGRHATDDHLTAHDAGRWGDGHQQSSSAAAPLGEGTGDRLSATKWERPTYNCDEQREAAHRQTSRWASADDTVGSRDVTHTTLGAVSSRDYNPSGLSSVRPDDDRAYHHGYQSDSRGRPPSLMSINVDSNRRAVSRHDDYDKRERERRSPPRSEHLSSRTQTQSYRSLLSSPHYGHRHGSSWEERDESRHGYRDNQHGDRMHAGGEARWSGSVGDRHHTPAMTSSTVTPSLAAASKPSATPPVQAETVAIETLLDSPHRASRPEHLVLILRGLPGSGKTFAAKKIRDREMCNGGEAPRMLCLDDYFLTETEVTEKDPETGRRIKVKKQEYDYDEAAEPSCRASMLKAFGRTLDDRLFKLIVVDCVNQKVADFEQFWLTAKLKGYDVFVAEMEESVDVCAERNVHDRSLAEIRALSDVWEATPSHFKRVDLSNLCQEAIEEVEMEDSGGAVKNSNKMVASHLSSCHGNAGSEDTYADGANSCARPSLSNDQDGSSPSTSQQVTVDGDVSGGEYESDGDADSGDADDNSDVHGLQPVKSRWDSGGDGGAAGGRLNKLDGIRKSSSLSSSLASDGEQRKPSLSSWTGLGGNGNESMEAAPTRKKNSRGYVVRWADLEEEKERARKRDIGFHPGMKWKDLMPSNDVNRYLAGDS